MPLHIFLQKDFERARTAFDSGDYATAEELFSELRKVFKNSDTDCEVDAEMEHEVWCYLQRISGLQREIVVSRRSDSYWEWFASSDKPPYEITGKYLFFSHIRKVLADFACEEIRSRRFHLAKIPVEGRIICKEHVLCLYYSDDSLKHELAEKYRNREDLKYRYWKSDESTRRGVYSRQFLMRARMPDALTGSHDMGDENSHCARTSDGFDMTIGNIKWNAFVTDQPPLAPGVASPEAGSSIRLNDRG